MKNIILIGMPGSGKSTVGKLLADELHMSYLDVDDFIIEQTGLHPEEHLSQLGDEDFLRLEAEMVKLIQAENTVISTTGSIPLHEPNMDHLQKNSIVIWLDLDISRLSERIGQRSDGATRIVGADLMSLEEIAEYRRSHYARAHDHHLQIADQSPEQIVQTIKQLLR